MAQTLEQTQQEILNIQQDRMRIINENEVRFKKLENAINELQGSNEAQIKVNQLFQQQLKDLEIRLKKEEIKPLVAIPSISPVSVVPVKQSFFSKLFKK